MKTLAPTALIALILGLTSCSSIDRPNILFLDRNEMSVSIKGSAPEQSARLNVGYSNESFALVPTGEPNAGPTHPEAHSVFAAFGLNAESGQALGVRATRVFATGAAAQNASKNIGDYLVKAAAAQAAEAKAAANKP